MTQKRRAPKPLALLLAVPIVSLVYLAAFFGRFARVFRPALTPLLGASMIGSTFAAQALRQEPAKRPSPALTALALAIALVAPAVTTVPTVAAADPQQRVIELTMSTVGSPYVFGSEGPNKFDCSGLAYWVYKEAGELPRVGGYRRGARSFVQWFVARGRFSKNEADARPGDLVAWEGGAHLGIYIGPNRVVSALNPSLGVRLHDLFIGHRPSHYLLVNWGTNDGGGGGDNGGGDNGGGDNGGGDNGGGDPTPAPDDDGSPGSGASDGDTGFDPPAATARPTQPPTPKPTPAPPDSGGGGEGLTGQAISESTVGTLPTATRTNPQPEGSNAVAIATVNLRELPDATSRILGWVGSGGYVTIVATAFSPAGNLYYKVTTAGGASGWVYSHWVLRTP